MKNILGRVSVVGAIVIAIGLVIMFWPSGNSTNNTEQTDSKSPEKSSRFMDYKSKEPESFTFIGKDEKLIRLSEVEEVILKNPAKGIISFSFRLFEPKDGDFWEGSLDETKTFIRFTEKDMNKLIPKFNKIHVKGKGLLLVKTRNLYFN